MSNTNPFYEMFKNNHYYVIIYSQNEDKSNNLLHLAEFPDPPKLEEMHCVIEDFFKTETYKQCDSSMYTTLLSGETASLVFAGAKVVKDE